MNVTSALAYSPRSYINPIYCATKAFMHSFTVNLRTQLEKADSRNKVVEIVPPLAESDLHRDRKDPDDNKKGKNPGALSVEEFMEGVIKGYEKEEETIAPGMAGQAVKAWYDTFGDKYKEATK